MYDDGMLPTMLARHIMNSHYGLAMKSTVGEYPYIEVNSTRPSLKSLYKRYLYGSDPYVTFLDEPVTPNCIVKLIDKENNKMEAKKCDRCGKLYEMPKYDERSGANVRFSFIPVNDADDLSEKRIAEKQSKNIVITLDSYREGGTTVDLCPECRKSLKMWFESGVNEK